MTTTVLINLVFAIYFLWVWLMLRGRACFLCGRPYGDKRCGCPGVRHGDR